MTTDARPEFVRAALSEARLALDRKQAVRFPREGRRTEPSEWSLRRAVAALAPAEPKEAE